MQKKTSKILLISLFAIPFITILSGLFINLLTDDNYFKEQLKTYIGTRDLIWGLILSGIILSIFAYFQLKHTEQNEQTAETETLTKDVETDVKRFYESLKERYEKRYLGKLDGRFEITLEVSENWDGQNIQKFKGEYEGQGQIHEAFEYIQKAFDEKGRLLILGNPGVGKTVLLLKLALELLKKTDIKKKEAFPVIFNLASWADEYENFEDWLISVLNSSEGLSKDFARKLLQEERIVFLLDGLDELARDEEKTEASEKRADCLKSLNEYLDRGKKAVICSREEEFAEMRDLTGKDAPVSAKVKIHDLSEAEILNSLMKAQLDNENKVAATNLLEIVKKAENEIFLKVLRTPFYFTTALEVFDKQILEEKEFPKYQNELENYLRRNFIDKKLNKVSSRNNFHDKQKNEHWLKCLAQLMKKKQLIIFELADLQPDDLTSRWKFRLVFGLIVSLVVGWFVAYVFGLNEGLNETLGFGLLFGLVSGSVFVLLLGSVKIQTEDTFILDISRLFDWTYWKVILFNGLVLTLILGLVLSIILGLIVVLVEVLFLGWLDDLYVLFVGSLKAGLYISWGIGLFTCLLIGFDKLKVVRQFSRLENPYQRVSGGFIINLIFVELLIIFNLVGLNFWHLYLQNIYFIGTFFIISFSILFYCPALLLRTPLFRHLILRFCLYQEDKMPLKYATFLDYSAEIGILEKDGGHWRFRHQNLQDYLADLDEKELNKVS